MHRTFLVSVAVVAGLTVMGCDTGPAVESNRADIEAVEKLMRKMAAETPGIEVDYLAVVDPDTFLPPADFHHDVMVAGAIRIGKTRLIDNIRISKRAIPHAHIE